MKNTMSFIFALFICSSLLVSSAARTVTTSIKQPSGTEDKRAEDCCRDKGHHGKSLFSGEFYEENKNKTLEELREQWLEKLSKKLDEDVKAGRLTAKEAEEAYKNAAEGKPFRGANKKKQDEN